MNIGIYIYEQAEVLDFAGPFEVFSTAKRLGAESLNVFLVSENGKPVVARGGLLLICRCQSRVSLGVTTVSRGALTFYQYLPLIFFRRGESSFRRVYFLSVLLFHPTFFFSSHTKLHIFFISMVL